MRMYIGGTFAFAMTDAMMDPIGQRKVKGNSRTPASRGERPFTTMNRCGIRKIAAVKGAPRKKPLLFEVNAGGVFGYFQGSLTAACLSIYDA
jgi:hypothetical protein